MLESLKSVIKSEWGLVLSDDADLTMTLLELAESIACETEGKPIEEVYLMNLGHPLLHLPGLISISIIVGLGLDTKKVNNNMTLHDILSLKTP